MRGYGLPLSGTSVLRSAAVLVITEYPSAIDKQGDFAVGLIDRSRSLVRRDAGSLPEPGQRHAGKSLCRVRWDQRRTKGFLLKDPPARSVDMTYAP
jgi:hypothetical protein